MSDVDYAELQASDYDDIIRLWEETGLPHRSHGRDSQKRLTAEIKRMPDLHLGAYVKGRLIGTVIGSYDGRRGCVNRLAVLPPYRKLGVARKLVELCEERLRRIGASVIFCLIDGDNLPSLSLFQKLGYRVHPDIVYLSKRDSAES